MAAMRVYLNGRWETEDSARISFDDRGFLFGDAVYEVIHLYDGQPFRAAEHLDRLERSQRGIELDPVPRAELEAVVAELAQDAASYPDASLYIEVSRGASPRNHAFPDPPVPPTVLAWVRPVATLPVAEVRRGITVVTVPDDRWAKCWIKTVNLLPNVLAKEKARRRGAQDAIFVRDGMAIEATSANLFRVKRGTLQTAPVTNYILPGITRDVILELAPTLGIPVRLEPFTVEELYEADEVFLTGTTSEILPVTRVDSQPIGHGMGPVAEALLQAYKALVGRSWPTEVRR
jgi:D-alanine transaminase